MRIHSNHGHEVNRLEAPYQLADSLAAGAAADSGDELGWLAENVSGFARQLSAMAGDIRVAETLVTASLIEIGSSSSTDQRHPHQVHPAPETTSRPQDLDTVVSVLGEIVARTTQLADRANIAALHTLVKE